MRDWTKRQWAIAGGVLLAVLVIVGIGFAVTGGGGDEDVVASTTSTTEATTTTTEPPPTFPLTGLPAEDPALAARPALVVKIDNAEPRSGQGGRPQAGINLADVVYEEMVEGSVTRFFTIFHSTDADPVGPVRSARTTDLLLAGPLNKPLFAWSGANANVIGQVKQADLVDVGYDAQSSVYRRVGDRPAPYNLFSSTPSIRGTVPAEERPPPALFEYRKEGREPKGGREVPGVVINYGGGPGSAPVDYVWDGSGWARSQRGNEHLDADGKRVAPPNVIVQFTPYAEVQCCDTSGFPIVEAQLIGEGDAWILTRGKLIEARWTRKDHGSVTKYTTPDGDPVKLTPGRTWVAIAPPGAGTVK